MGAAVVRQCEAPTGKHDAGAPIDNMDDWTRLEAGSYAGDDLLKLCGFSMRAWRVRRKKLSTITKGTSRVLPSARYYRAGLSSADAYGSSFLLNSFSIGDQSLEKRRGADRRRLTQNVLGLRRINATFGCGPGGKTLQTAGR